MTTNTTNTPTTREAAIALLVDQDVARWGESERAAAARMHAERTIGLALNELANRAEIAGEPSKELRAAARKALTQSDRDSLRRAR